MKRNGIWTWSIYISLCMDYDFCSSVEVTGIRTSISGNVLSSLSSVPANDETLTTISLIRGQQGTSSKINRAENILPIRQDIRNTSR